MKLVFRADLSSADLATLLEEAGRPAPLNLRPDTPPGTGGDDNGRARLAAAGLVTGGQEGVGQLSAVGRAMADVLLSPRHVVEMSVWTAAQRGSMTVAFPASPPAGAGVIVNRHDGAYSLGGFVDDTAVGDLVAPVLATLPAEAAVMFEAVLTVDQATVLAAVLDGAATQDRSDRAFSARHVAEWLAIWWGSAGPERLCGQVFSFALRPDPPDLGTVVAMLKKFTAAGLLHADDSARYRLAPTLEKMVALLAAVDSGLDWQRVSAGAEGEEPAGRIVHILASGEGGLLLELAGDDRIVIETVGRVEGAAFLAGELAVRMPEFEPDPAAAAPQVDATTPRRAHFCTRCGHPLEPSWKFCGACGALIEKN